MARKRKSADNQGPSIEDSNLGAILGRELRQSLTYDQSQLSNKRAITQEYIRGIMPDLPGRPNGSQQTSRDISDVMSWMLPGIMRTMTASDQMVRYSATEEEQDEWAEEATAYANWSFFRDNDGYRNLYNATWDSLAMGNGIAICYYEPEQTKDQLLRNQTPEDIQDLLDEVGAASLQDLIGPKAKLQILSRADGEPKQIEDENGNPVMVPTVTLKVRKVIREGRMCHTTAKTENLLINAAATTFEDARFVAYLHDDWTRSDLLEMGFDKTLVDDLAPGPNFARNQVELARRYELTTNWQSPIRSGDRIDVYECYIKADADGDGIAELLQVFYAGTIGAGVVLSWDYWEDDIPFTDIPCFPIPHRWDAESIADRTIDIQRVKTVLLRGLLDSTYWAITPQRVAAEGSILNPDAMVNPRFGSTLWAKKGTDPNNAVVPLQVPYTGDKAVEAMAAMDELITKRTGVSRTTMALDPEALTNQTATATQAMRDAGYSQVELVARNMAELGWSKYFAKFLRLAVKNKIVARIPNPDAGKPKAANNQEKEPQFILVQTGNWSDGMDVSINTGLGTGSRDRDMAMLNTMLSTQMVMADKLAATGVPTLQAKAMQLIPKIIQTAKLQAESAGIKDPSDHYIDVTEDDIAKALQESEQARSQGDPKMAIEQMKAQGQQALQQAQMQTAQIKGQAEQAKSDAELRIKILQEQSELRALQDRSTNEQLQVQLNAAKADADNATKLKIKAMELQTQLDIARINKGADLETTVFSKYLDSLIGIQQHEQAKDLASHQAAVAPQPTAPAN